MANREATNVSQAGAPTTLEMPAPTAFPIVLASAVTLLFAGLVTSASISMLGIVLMIVGSVGWFRDVLPIEDRESIPVLKGPPTVRTMRRCGDAVHDRWRAVARAAAPRDLPGLGGPEGRHCRRCRDGAARDAVRARERGQCLVPDQPARCRVLPSAATASIEALAAFHLARRSCSPSPSTRPPRSSSACCTGRPYRCCHAGRSCWAASSPRSCGPGLLRSALGIINPVLDAHIDWLWFVAVTAGVRDRGGARSSRGRSEWRRGSAMPLAVRVGIEATRHDEEDR